MSTVTDVPQPAGCEATGETCEAHDCTTPEQPRSDGGGQPCPPPLMWQQVVETVCSESTPFEVARAGRTIRGRAFGEGKPLYFLNGIGGTHDLFALSAWLFHDSFRSVLFDYAAPLKRNAGTSNGVAGVERSEPPATAPMTPALPPRLESLSDDLIAIADHLRDETFSLYATSFGSIVALAAMIKFPDRIERAVVQGGFARIRLSAAERLLIRAAGWLPGTLRRMPLRKLVQRASHRTWFPPFDQTRFEFFSDNTGEVPIATLAARGVVIREADLRPLLGRITTPLMLLRCEGEGRVSTSAHDELKAGLPHARAEYMAGCGHLPYLTHPHRLGKLIVPFLMGVESPESQ